MCVVNAIWVNVCDRLDFFHVLRNEVAYLRFFREVPAYSLFLEHKWRFESYIGHFVS
jgi:hypothetical protein